MYFLRPGVTIGPATRLALDNLLDSKAIEGCLFYRLDDLEGVFAVLDPTDSRRVQLVKRLKSVDLLVDDDFPDDPGHRCDWLGKPQCALCQRVGGIGVDHQSV